MSQSLIAQKTKKIKNILTNPDRIEVFHVLKSDKNIKHGKYKLTDKEYRIICEGFYKNNLKDSIWTDYNAK
jgi:mRNA-degrading endonuclease RelE of RelBE toxin-antitoxin system